MFVRCGEELQERLGWLLVAGGWRLVVVGWWLVRGWLGRWAGGRAVGGWWLVVGGWVVGWLGGWVVGWLVGGWVGGWVGVGWLLVGWWLVGGWLVVGWCAGGGRRRGADTALKTKTPHINVGNKQSIQLSRGRVCCPSRRPDLGWSSIMILGRPTKLAQGSGHRPVYPYA